MLKIGYVGVLLFVCGCFEIDEIGFDELLLIVIICGFGIGVKVLV